MSNDSYQKKLKKSYKEMFLKTREIVNSYDPMGLVPPAPEDEYDMEVTRILNILRTINSVDELTSEIRNIIGEFFGRDIELQDELFDKLSQEIWKVKVTYFP